VHFFVHRVQSWQTLPWEDSFSEAKFVTGQ